jgi:hypothetical protein
MKPQDIVFLIVLGFLFWKYKPKYFTITGLIFLTLAIPLFLQQIFFTAQRLTMYGGVCMLIAMILMVIKERKNT